MNRSAQSILEQQQTFFFSGKTLPLKNRKESLRKLLSAIKKFDSEIIAALKKDLHKSDFEAFTNETGVVCMEIRHILRHLDKWAKPQKKKIELFLRPGSGTIYAEPYGVSLVIAPWNYPFQLAIAPLAIALAAGNTVILKPSEVSCETAKLLTTFIETTFPPELVAVVNGGPEETSALLALSVDKIFFTGSVSVGKIVMEAAAKNLTPITLELGGKSPVIVDESANLKNAAKKIVWGKFNNAGQTCIAPDYILVHTSVEKELLRLMKEAIREFYGENPEQSENYGRIINERHTRRLEQLLIPAKTAIGGMVKPDCSYIEPTILTDVTLNDICMRDEIFGPILPIIRYETIAEAIEVIRSFPKPLALYLFTEKQEREREILNAIRFGGGSINTVILHVASSNLPFGGVGPSGMGSYHGKAGFDTFSHHKSILRQPSFFDHGLTYPGSKVPLSLIRKFMKYCFAGQI